MATTTGSKKLIIKNFKILVLFTFCYSIIVFMTLPFVMVFSWGEKLNILEKIFLFFIGRPFKISISLWLIPINGIFWGAIVVGIKSIFQRN